MKIMVMLMKATMYFIFSCLHNGKFYEIKSNKWLCSFGPSITILFKDVLEVVLADAPNTANTKKSLFWPSTEQLPPKI